MLESAELVGLKDYLKGYNSLGDKAIANSSMQHNQDEKYPSRHLLNSEKNKRNAMILAQRFNFSHGGKKKSHKKKGR